jgi:hypothetical protein
MSNLLGRQLPQKASPRASKRRTYCCQSSPLSQVWSDQQEVEAEQADYNQFVLLSMAISPFDLTFNYYEAVVQFVAGGFFGLSMLWAGGKLRMSVEEIKPALSPTCQIARARHSAPV